MTRDLPLHRSVISQSLKPIIYIKACSRFVLHRHSPKSNVEFRVFFKESKKSVNQSFTGKILFRSTFSPFLLSSSKIFAKKHVFSYIRILCVLYVDFNFRWRFFKLSRGDTYIPNKVIGPRLIVWSIQIAFKWPTADHVAGGFHPTGRRPRGSVHP